MRHGRLRSCGGDGRSGARRPSPPRLRTMANSSSQPAMTKKPPGGSTITTQGWKRGPNSGNAEEGAGAQDFAHAADHGQAERKAQPHADGVERRRNRRRPRRMRLGAAEHQAVGDDQLDIGAERLVEVEADRLDRVIDHGDEGGDDDDVGGDAHLLRDQVAQQRNQEAGGGQHEGGGQPHRDRVDRRHGDGEGRAHAEHHHEHRVALPHAFGELLPWAGGRDAKAAEDGPLMISPSIDRAWGPAAAAAVAPRR